jgi:DNA-binding PadR family transcriptional regulator
MTERRPFASALEPEFLILGLLSQEADHGYGLQQRIETKFPWIWRISQSQTYNILKRLESQGDLGVEDVAGEGAPQRRLYQLSPRGKARFESWLRSPTPSSARAIRIEFLTKLFFALESDVDLARRLVHDQTSALKRGLDRLHKSAMELTDENRLSQLALDLRIRQLETALSWLEGIERFVETAHVTKYGDKI